MSDQEQRSSKELCTDSLSVGGRADTEPVAGREKPYGEPAKPEKTQHAGGAATQTNASQVVVANQDRLSVSNNRQELYDEAFALLRRAGELLEHARARHDHELSLAYDLNAQAAAGLQVRVEEMQVEIDTLTLELQECRQAEPPSDAQRDAVEIERLKNACASYQLDRDRLAAENARLKRRVADQDAEFASCFGQAMYTMSALRALTREDTPANRALDEATGESKVEYEALLSVIGERRRQVEQEGWTAEHDDEHTEGELSAAAACYALHASEQIDMEGHEIDEDILPEHWPWDAKWWKPSDPRRNLVKAAALLIAEIERLDRQPSTKDALPPEWGRNDRMMAEQREREAGEPAANSADHNQRLGSPECWCGHRKASHDEAGCCGICSCVKFGASDETKGYRRKAERCVHGVHRDNHCNTCD